MFMTIHTLFVTAIPIMTEHLFDRQLLKGAQNIKISLVQVMIIMIVTSNSYNTSMGKM